MARRENISNLKGNSHKSYSSKRGLRNLSARILIVTEGEKTERFYFDHFRKDQTSKIRLHIEIEGGQKNTMSIVNNALRLSEYYARQGEAFDKVWVVFDKDEFPDFQEAIEKAERSGLSCAWSNPCFELWFLLHLKDCGISLPHHKMPFLVEKEINHKKARLHEKKTYSYKKNDPELYAIIQKYGSEDKAVKRAEQLHFMRGACRKFDTHNPGTKVHLLVKQLRRQDQEFEQALLMES